MEAPNLNNLWAAMLVEELVRNGIKTFVIAPGSRSAPLAVEAFRNVAAETIIHFDERGAAFYALGCGRVGKPAALICTSGTAVTNCWPAVAEAFYSGLPLVILSADRPPELQGCAANQTMDQARLFGAHVRAHLELPCPDTQIPPEAWLTRVDALLAAGLGGGRGPVHINCMFREPLAPVPENSNTVQGYRDRLVHWQESRFPITQWKETGKQLSSTQCQTLADTLNTTDKGLLVIGRLQHPADQEAVLELANKLGWPVFADIISGCRRLDTCKFIIGHYDLLLCSETFKNNCAPACILHLGDVLVSKRLQQFLLNSTACYLQISERSENTDNLHRVNERYTADIKSACRQLIPLLKVMRPASRFQEACVAIDRHVQNESKRVVEEEEVLSELFIAQVLDAQIPSEKTLFIGNSMPVRDMDSVASNCRAGVVHANRGLSGIDGNIATAAGMAVGRPGGVVAVIGDMAALHDLNSLALVQQSTSPVILVIINNQGGGIFNFLPIAEHKEVLQPCFINPHSWRFDAAAAMFNIDYRQVATKQDLREALHQGLTGTSSMILEAIVDREHNKTVHDALYREIDRSLEDWFEVQPFSFE